MDICMAAPDMSTTVHIAEEGELVRATLHGPEKRNALDEQALEHIRTAAAKAKDASVLLLQGDGDVFCAGFDVPLMKRDPSQVNTLIESLSQTCKALRRCAATVVVDVQGAAIAGGCALAVSSDVLIARHGARFGYPVHALGISPAVTIPVLLPAAGGLARSMLMSGRLYPAEQLHEAGMVHHLMASSDSLDPLIESLLQRGLAAAQATKGWINTLDGSLQDDRFDRPVKGSCGLRIRQD